MNSKSGIVTNSLTDPVCNPGAHLCLLFGVNMYFMVWFLSAKFNLHFNDLSVLQTMNVISFGYIIKNRLIMLKFSGYSDYSNLGVGYPGYKKPVLLRIFMFRESFASTNSFHKE